MEEEQRKKINQTFSLPLDISQDLHTYVKRREMSGFVAEAIRKELKLKKTSSEKLIVQPMKMKVNLRLKNGTVRQVMDQKNGNKVP